MKKALKSVISCFLSMLLIFSLVVSVSAASPELDTSKPYFQIESKSANMGDEVEVNVSIANNPGFWSAKLSVTYDDGLYFVKDNGMPVVSVSNNFSSQGTVDYNYELGKLTVLITSNDLENITGNGVLLTLKIKVDNDAVTGDYNLIFTDYSSTNFIDCEGEKVGFTFGDGVISVKGKTTTILNEYTSYDYSFEAINCSPVASVSSTLGTHYQSDINPAMNLSRFIPTESGQYVDYTLSSLPAGTYNLFTYSRDYTSDRGTFDVYVDGELFNTISFIGTSLSMNYREVGTFTLSETKDVTVRFVASETVGKMYLAGFELYKDRPKYEITTVDIYTMDEGSRPSVYGVTRDYPNNTEFVSESENNVLSYEKTTDGVGLINRSLYFKLPDDIYTKYSNLISLTITLKTDYGTFYSHNNGYNRIYMSSYPTEIPTSSNAVKVVSNSTYTFTTTAKEITIDMASINGANIINNDYKYFNVINSVDTNNGNTYKHLYIDSVTLTYNKPMEGYYVTIDDENTFVSKGETFTFPSVDDDDIAVYKDAEGNYYACGSEIEVTEDVTFTPVKLSLKTLNKASMRLINAATNYVSGIRFYTTFDTTVVDTLREAGITVSFGTLIAPNSYFGGNDLTVLKHGVDFGKTNNYVDVLYSASKYHTSSGFTGIVGSLGNIKDDHALWDFIGRGYAKITVNGTTKTVYAQGDTELPSRSIGYIAYMLKNDTASYELLDDVNKEMVDKYYEMYCQYLAVSDPYSYDKFE